MPHEERMTTVVETAARLPANEPVPTGYSASLCPARAAYLRSIETELIDFKSENGFTREIACPRSQIKKLGSQLYQTPNLAGK